MAELIKEGLGQEVSSVNDGLVMPQGGEARGQWGREERGRRKPRVSRDGKACVLQPSITLERCDCPAGRHPRSTFLTNNLRPISAQLLTEQVGE